MLLSVQKFLGAPYACDLSRLRRPCLILKVHLKNFTVCVAKQPEQKHVCIGISPQIVIEADNHWQITATNVGLATFLQIAANYKHFVVSSN